MKAMGRVKFYAVVLIIASILFHCGSVGFESDALSSKTLDDLNSKLDSLTKKQQQLEASIKKNQGQQQTQMQRKKDLDNQINLCEEKIDLLVQKINELSTQISNKEKEITNAQDNINKRYEMYRLRVRALYEQGSATYLEVLLESKSLGDFLARLDLVGDIMEYDKKLIDQMSRFKKNLEETKASLEQDKKSQEEAKKQLDETEKKLKADYNEAQKIIKQLEADEAAYKKAYLEAEKEEEKVRAQIKAEIKRLQELEQSKYVGGDLEWPLPGYTNITSPYGWRIHPIFKDKRFHSGVDIGAPKGAKIIAANSGKVIKAEYNSAYGNFIVIDHGGGLSTMYAHMSAFAVSKGSTVKKGDRIGSVGSTGFATGPHLHFEIWKNGDNVDPMSYFKKVK